MTGSFSDGYGVVANPGAGPASLYGTVHGGRYPADLTGTVSRSMIDAWDGPSLYFRFRVEIDGEPIPDDELIGPLSVSDTPIDGLTAGFTFGLRGLRWGVFATVKTWTRVVVIDVYLDHGPEGGVIEPGLPDYSGYVIGCEQSGSYEPEVHVSCGDRGAIYARHDACMEVAPGAGYTDGQIIDLICGDAGIPVTRPDGGVYTKGLQLANKNTLTTLKGFCERKGWALRFLTDGTLEVWTPSIKLPPQPPDYRWSTAELKAPARIHPPSEVPSKWVLTANSLVDIDELGYVTESTTTEIKALTAPKVAVSQQHTDGTITATAFVPPPDAVITVSLIVDETVKKGGRVIVQRTTQWALYNYRAARLRSNASAGGTPGLGFSYLSVFIDSAGNYVQNSMEQLDRVLYREITNSYDTAWTLVGSNERAEGWGNKTEGVRHVDTDPASTTVLNAYVFGDDQSYVYQTDNWGLQSEVDTSYEYTDQGLVKTITESYRNFSPKCRTEGALPPASLYYWQLYNGTSQYDMVASWGLFERKEETQILRDGQLVGKDLLTYAYAAPHRANGAYDWGEFRSDADKETFQWIAEESHAFQIIDGNSYQQISYNADGSRTVETFYGKLPTTRYKGSVWTSKVSQPLEAVLEDGTAYLWWGFQREAWSDEYVQNNDEALLVIGNRRKRAMSKKVELQRCDTLARVGDTVLLDIPEQGILGRFIVVERRPREWTTPQPVATYLLEGWAS